MPSPRISWGGLFSIHMPKTFQDALRDVWNKAAATVGTAPEGLYPYDAADRFTRTPIDFKNWSYGANSRGNKLNADAAQGEFNPTNNRIQVEMAQTSPEWNKLQQVIAHEGTHSAISHAKQDIPENLPLGFLDSLKFMGTLRDTKPEYSLFNGFNKSMYMGNPLKEVPAQAVAYHEGNLPGVSPGDRERYLQKLAYYLQQNNPALGQTLKRIQSSYSNSQR